MVSALTNSRVLAHLNRTGDRAILRSIKSFFVSVAIFFAPILRFLGGLFVLGAVIAITADFSRAASGFASLHQHLTDLTPGTLATLQLDATDRSISAAILKSYLDLPAFLSLGLTGISLLWLGRRRRQVQIFAN